MLTAEQFNRIKDGARAMPNIQFNGDLYIKADCFLALLLQCIEPATGVTAAAPKESSNAAHA